MTLLRRPLLSYIRTSRRYSCVVSDGAACSTIIPGVKGDARGSLPALQHDKQAAEVRQLPKGDRRPASDSTRLEALSASQSRRTSLYSRCVGAPFLGNLLLLLSGHLFRLPRAGSTIREV
jgi:hypothetical protein